MQAARRQAAGQNENVVAMLIYAGAKPSFACTHTHQENKKEKEVSKNRSFRRWSILAGKGGQDKNRKKHQHQR